MTQSLTNIGQHMQDWYHSPAGSSILQQETILASKVCQQQKAHAILHIGGANHQFNALASSDAYIKQLQLSQLGDGKHPIIIPCADTQQLRPQSFDHILLTQVIEFYQAPVPLLRDCYDLLADSGRLIIYAFNPWSLWGLSHILSSKTGLPRRSSFHAASTVQQWLRQLGLAVEDTSSFYFRPPTKTGGNLDRYAWLDKVGQHCWPYCGGLYQIIAQKQVPGIRPNWSKWTKKRLQSKKSRNRFAQPTRPQNKRNERLKCKEKTLQHVELFTDGACRGNPGPGGWGALIRCGQQQQKLHGSEPLTTNNRMELMAVIEGLTTLTEAATITITTDSKYVQQGITCWIHNWKKKGWRTASGKQVKNIDLWQRLDALVQHRDIQWQWVKGHSGHAENDIADELANLAIDKLLAAS